VETKRKMRSFIVFLQLLALFGSRLALYGSDMIDYFGGEWKKEKTLAMSRISGGNW